MALYLLFGLPSRSGLRFHVIRNGASAGPVNRANMDTNPMSPYAGSKLRGEHYCPVGSRLGRLSTVSLRYFNVFGPGNSQSRRIRRCFRPSSLLGFQAPTSVALGW